MSLDWLLGLSQDEGLTGEIRESLEIEEAPGGFDRTLLARWHAEAAGTKIRYVPAGIPDLLRTEALIDYEAGITNRSRERAGRRDAVPHRLQPPAGDRHGGLHAAPHAGDLCARPGRLERISRGSAGASSLPTWRRCSTTFIRPSACFSMTAACAIPCPTRSSARYRAAIYVGDMYLVLNATQPVRTLTRHFDNLIRAADINAHEAAGFTPERWPKCDF